MSEVNTTEKTKASVAAHEGNLRGFQSRKALDAATAPKPPASAEPVMGEVGKEGGDSDSSDEQVVVKKDDLDKMVTVRVRQNCLNMRVGPKTFSLKAGVPTLVPRYVQMHLEEKGLI